MSNSANQPNVAAAQPKASAARQTAIIQSNAPKTISYDTRVSEPPKPKKLAVFVAHGMGQQLKFETLNQMAQGLIEREEATGRTRSEITIEPPVVTIRAGEKLLHGLKLKLASSDYTEREVHIFEGYWAPLAEGQVRLRDVIYFLITAGFNGVRNFGDRFDRWLFGEYRKYPSRISLTICLLVVLAVVASLAVMDTTVAIIAIYSIAGYFGFLSDGKWDWVNGLTKDLTTTYDVFILLALLFGCALWAGTEARKLGIKSRRGEFKIEPKTGKLAHRAALNFSRASNLIAWGLFGLTLGATILCGVTIPLLVYAHNRSKAPGETYWAQAFGSGFYFWLNEVVSYLFLGLLLVLLTWLIVAGIFKFLGAMRRIDNNSLKVMIGTGAVLILVSLILFKLAFAVYQSWAGLGQFWVQVLLVIKSNISWMLLVIVSLWVRRLLVQYVGDVALYITSHTLDRFDSLRDKIRKYVFDSARAVYSCRNESGEFEYDGVFIIGHSLGSVIAYDTLNRLLDEDEVANGDEKLDVLDRTKLLLTLGSPLDKITFLFSLQREKTSLEREALVASSQPLILDPKFRDPSKFEWINIFSHNDIISGRLNFFDPPAESTTRKLINPVKNIQDKEATTLLAAHVEYWDNQLVFKKLHEKLTEKLKVGQRV